MSTLRSRTLWHWLLVMVITLAAGRGGLADPPPETKDAPRNEKDGKTAERPTDIERFLIESNLWEHLEPAVALNILRECRAMLLNDDRRLAELKCEKLHGLIVKRIRGIEKDLLEQNAAQLPARPVGDKPSTDEGGYVNLHPEQKGAYSNREIVMYRALNSTTSIDFRNVSLKDVLNFIEDKTQEAISFIVDAEDFKKGQVDLDDSVNLKGKNLTVRQILRTVLEQRKLAFHIKDSLVVITSADKKYLDTKVYAIAGLLDAKKPEASQAELEKIIRLLAPQSWEGKKGEEPSIVFFTHKQLMVVRQSLEVHEQIERLLADMGVLSARGNADLSGVDLDCAPGARRLLRFTE